MTESGLFLNGRIKVQLPRRLLEEFAPALSQASPEPAVWACADRIVPSATSPSHHATPPKGV